jgi:prolyl-tRNA editing enzyme YbaK/EbsC (Cys-tRNA(Pro) deacylase)
MSPAVRLRSDPVEIERVVLEAVIASGADAQVIEVDPDLADTAAFCEHYGYPPETSGNCILVASRDDPPTMAACLALATTRLDVNKRVRKLLGVRKCSFAPAELTQQTTGMQIGGVTPFGLPDGLPIWIDARIRALDHVIVGGGSRSIKLLVAPTAFTAIGAEFVDDLAIPAG